MDMNIDHSLKALRLFVNIIITIPFLVTVVCCILVVHRLRSNYRRDRGDSDSDHRYSTVSRSRDFSRSTKSISRITLTNTCMLSRENSQLSSMERQNTREASSKTLNLASMREDSGSGVVMREPNRDCQQRAKWSRDCLSRADTVSSRSQHQDTGSSRRASITITIITAAFIISYGPYMILWIYSLLVHELRLFDPVVTITSTHWSIYLYIYLVGTTLLSTFNSCIFPLIYFIRIKGRLRERFRESYRDVLSFLKVKQNRFNYEAVNGVKKQEIAKCYC